MMERRGREAPLLQLERDSVTRSTDAASPIGHRTAFAGAPFRYTIIDETPSLFTLSILFCFKVRKPKKRLDAVPMGFSAGDMGRPAINPAPRKSTPARPANLRVMIISAQTRPTPSPYKPRPAVQYISCHPYLALASSTCGFREAVASSVPPPLALRLMGSLQSDSRISLGRLLLIRVCLL